MSELSLNELASGRQGVEIEQIDLRRTCTLERISDEQAQAVFGAAVKLKPLPPLRGLPAGPNVGTSLTTHLTRLEAEDQWRVVWAPFNHANDHAREMSERVGGMLGLEATLSGIWEGHSGNSVTIFFVKYVLSGWRTPLINSRKRSLSGGAVAKNIGAFWQIEGGPRLVGVSVTGTGAKGLSLLAIAKLTSGGWPNVAALEVDVWQDLQQVVQRGGG